MKKPLRLAESCAVLFVIILNVCAIGVAFSAEKHRNVIVALDRVVAVVNNSVITRLELDEHLQLAINQLTKQGTPIPPQKVLEKQLLERLITNRVQLQFAAETGLRVDDAQLEKALSRIAQDNNLSLVQFRTTLEKDGVNFPKFREEIRDEIIMARLREREVDNKILVTEGEVENYLKTQETQGIKADEYSLAHILVQIPGRAGPDQIRAAQTKAEKALTQIKSGVDFGQVSASFSDAAYALKGGAIGWRSADKIPTLFYEAIKTLKAGEVSAILRSPNGFHIIKVLEMRGEGAPVIVVQNHVRHILIKPSEVVSESEAKSHLLQLKDRLDHGMDFAELAKQHSQDASASKGGDLGWVSPGDTVSEFEQTINALVPGQISDPVQTQFGWHLIQLLERRNEDMSQEKRQFEVRTALRERKSGEAYQEWVRQLRDQAYVEYRVEDD